MLNRRIIPTLLLQDRSLVKTKQFSDAKYIGDPLNTILVFNELEVDEIILLDIGQNDVSEIQFEYIEKIAQHCFVPFSYGGGISSMSNIERLLRNGCEKVVINSLLFDGSEVVRDAIEKFGSQAIVASIDYKIDRNGIRVVYRNNGKCNSYQQLDDWINFVTKIGVGEIILTSIDHEGTYLGFDELGISDLISNLGIPVIIHGGCSNTDDLKKLFSNSDASAAGVGSTFVFHKKDQGVLINYPQPRLADSLRAL